MDDLQPYAGLPCPNRCSGRACRLRLDFVELSRNAVVRDAGSHCGMELVFAGLAIVFSLLLASLQKVPERQPIRVRVQDRRG